MSIHSTLRSDYGYFATITTRWMDNDVYGHVNNVTYYSYFDSVANRYLIEQGGLNIHTAEAVGFVVASKCDYLRPIAYPEEIEVGLRVNRLGQSSVEYGMAIFSHGNETAAAFGTFTHVFVTRASNNSAPIPDSIRRALEKIQVAVQTEQAE